MPASYTAASPLARREGRPQARASVADDEQPAGEVIARGIDAEAVQDEVLLLSALGLAHAVVPDEDGVALVVRPEDAERARRELREQRAEPGATADPALRGGARAAIPAALALVLGHAALAALPLSRRAAIYAAGELRATAVRAGEIERVVTALTLHADPAHVVGNAVATAIFVSAAGDWIGPGLALLLTVAAGAAGNLVAALLDAGHLAIGFSTATFGALGLSAVFGFVARYRDHVARRRAWLALGAGVALLALLGAGERSDVLAHILGLVAGAALGAAVAPFVRAGVDGPLTRAPTQLAAAAAAIAAVAWAWLRATRRIA